MRAHTSESGNLALLRLPPGSDLLQGIRDAARELGITAASVNVIGAVRRLVYGFYDQEAHEYGTLHHEGELEIASAMGNVSVKDGEPFVHLHIVATGTDGRALGGHLMEGTETFVAEVAFHVFRGDAPVREDDAETGLAVWRVG